MGRVLMASSLKPGPESGLDCLDFAEFARQRRHLEGLYEQEGLAQRTGEKGLTRLLNLSGVSFDFALRTFILFL